MSNILVIDTSGAACTVGLDCQGEILSLVETGERAHARRLLAMVDEVCQRAGIAPGALDALAVTTGPGSFTGLRIGVGVVQGLAMATDRPVVRLSALAAMAQSSFLQNRRRLQLPVTKARDDEVYAGAYAPGETALVQALVPDQALAPQQFRLSIPGYGPGDCAGIGDGWEYLDTLAAALGLQPEVVDPHNLITAKALGLLARRGFDSGEAVAADLVLPQYLKDNMNYRRAD